MFLLDYLSELVMSSWLVSYGVYIYAEKCQNVIEKGVKLNYYIVLAIENKMGYKFLNDVPQIYLLIRRDGKREWIRLVWDD